MTTEPLIENLLRDCLSPQDTLSVYRQKAMEKLVKIGAPHPRDEAFQYQRLQSYFKTPYSRAPSEPDNFFQKELAPFKNKITLVFYNGHFSQKLSQLDNVPSSLIVKPLSEAFYSYSAFFKNALPSWIESEQDFFALTSFATHASGIFMYLKSLEEVSEPIHIIEINDVEQTSLLAPVIVGSCGKHSKLNLVSTLIEKNKSASIGAPLVHFTLEEGAKLNTTSHVGYAQTARFETHRIYQKSDSTYTSLFTAISPKRMRTSVRTKLLGEGSHASISSLAALKNEEESHMHILVEHLAERCTSSQLVKNLLDDKSISSFEGKIWVDAKAQQTNAYQLNQNCLLSDTCKAYSKPNLEIFADDVKASHGSTTGQVDPEQLFYLRSRGFSKKAAKKLLLHAFCQEVTDQVTVLKERVTQDLSHYFEGA